jgi:hypothetical protein
MRAYSAGAPRPRGDRIASSVCAGRQRFFQVPSDARGARRAPRNQREEIGTMKESSRSRAPERRAARRNYLILSVTATLVIIALLVAVFVLYPE